MAISIEDFEDRASANECTYYVKEAWDLVAKTSTRMECVWWEHKRRLQDQILRGGIHIYFRLASCFLLP